MFLHLYRKFYLRAKRMLKWCEQVVSHLGQAIYIHMCKLQWQTG